MPHNVNGKNITRLVIKSLVREKYHDGAVVSRGLGECLSMLFSELPIMRYHLPDRALLFMISRTSAVTAHA